MQLTIDTIKDKKEDIQRAIEFLKKLIDEPSSLQGSQPVPFASDAAASSFGSMFADEPREPNREDTLPKKDIPKVELY